MRTASHVSTIRSFLVSLTMAAVVVALPGCSALDADPPLEAPRFDFGGAPPYAIDAQSIEIVDLFKPTMLSPYVEHEYAIPPAEVARAWGTKRLTASGTTGNLRVIIRDASLIQRDLETSSGWRATVLDEPDIELSARLEVSLEYDGPIGASTARAVVSAKSTSYESASLADIDRNYYEMLEDMATELDQAFADQFDGELSRILARP